LNTYCKLLFGNQTFTTPDCPEGGQYPFWNFSASIKKNKEEDLILVQLYNKNIISQDELIGEGAFSFLQVKEGNNEKVEKNVTIFNKGLLIGNIKLELQFASENNN
jgi:hypothetical protein